MKPTKIKTKTLCFVVATTAGTLPSHPVPKYERALDHLPICRKYRADLEWGIFEVAQTTVLQDGVKTTEPPHVVNVASQEVCNRLLNEIASRYAKKYSHFRVQEAVTA